MTQRRRTLIILLVLLGAAYLMGAFTVWAAGNIDVTIR